MPPAQDVARRILGSAWWARCSRATASPAGSAAPTPWRAATLNGSVKDRAHRCTRCRCAWFRASREFVKMRPHGRRSRRLSRYNVLGSAAECEPGSNGLVLRNRLGISDPVVMDELERNQLLDLYQATIGQAISTKPLRASDLLGWHREWLCTIYDWAGKVRRFNLSKQGFAFASDARTGQRAG